MEKAFESAKTLVGLLAEADLHIATAESCTGGLVAATLISVPGASEVIEGAFVTYSDRMKKELLGVPQRILEKFTAVSAESAKEMAKGAKKKTGADIAVSTTGYAGPTGENVGLVYIGLCSKDTERVYRFRFTGNREIIRQKAANAALSVAIAEAKKEWKK